MRPEAATIAARHNNRNNRHVLINHKGKTINTSSATVTSKGQITISATIRNALNVNPGDRIQFIEVAPGRFEMLIACNDITSLKNMVESSHNASIEEMNQAIKRKGSHS